MTRFSFAAAALAALALPVCAIAQDVDPADEIVIQGERADRADARSQAQDITPRSGGWGDPLPRFNDPVCPAVYGLTQQNAQDVIDRIYDNAERAGADVDDFADCRANLWVIIVDDPQETFRQLRRENNFLLRYLNSFQRDRAADERGPTVAWNVVSTRNQYGGVVSAGNTSPFEIPTNETTAMSRTTSAVRLDIEYSVVLIERAALANFDAYAIADYVTMRALARTEEPEGGLNFASVMTLFEDGPERLTDFDLAYLQELYASSATRPARNFGGRVATLMDEANGLTDE